MAKSRREQQLDKTRRVEWAYYGVMGLAFALAFGLGASTSTLSWLFVATLVLGGAVWFAQYHANDELGRLRIVKSWAVVGIFNMFAVCALLAWYGVKLLPLARSVDFEQLALPFWPIYVLTLLNALMLPGTGAYLKWRDERA